MWNERKLSVKMFNSSQILNFRSEWNDHRQCIWALHVWILLCHITAKDQPLPAHHRELGRPPSLSVLQLQLSDHQKVNPKHSWLIDWMSVVLHHTRIYFIHMKMSPLSFKGCKLWAYAWYFWPLSRGGPLSFSTCCDTRALVFAI